MLRSRFVNGRQKTPSPRVALHHKQRHSCAVPHECVLAAPLHCICPVSCFKGSHQAGVCCMLLCCFVCRFHVTSVPG